MASHFAIEEISAESAEILEPNLQFYRAGPEDRSRYSVGPEVLHAIAWAATSIGLPIMLAGATEAVKIQVKGWLDRRKNREKEAPMLTKEAEEEIKRLFRTSETDQHKAHAISAVAEYLEHRGWPKPLAAANAQEIIEVIESRGKATS
jgi:hypothetical protein